jgi:hypothetical protein
MDCKKHLLFPLGGWTDGMGAPRKQDKGHIQFGIIRFFPWEPAFIMNFEEISRIQFGLLLLMRK